MKGGRHLEPLVLLFVSDRPVLSSLQFALAVEGWTVAEGGVAGSDPSFAAALLVDQGAVAAGLAILEALRESGCAAPAILLATNPTRLERAQATAAGAILIEKPLLGDELARALRAAVEGRRAA